MKLFKYLSFTLLASFLLYSCADESLGPIATFDNSGKGAYARLVQVIQGVDGYNLSQFGSTAYEYEVEFVTLEKQPLVDKYDIYVTFRDNSPQNGDQSKSEALFKSYGKSDFTTSAAGFQGITVSIPLSQAASALGLSEGDLAGADAFNFRSTITLNDGRTFSADNSTGAVNGSAFAGHFNFSAKLSCPLSDDKFVGAYTLEYDPGNSFPFGAETFGANGKTVTLKKVSGTKRSFSATYLEGLGIGNGPVNFVFELLCTIVIPDGNQGTGLGCGGTITLGPPATFANFNINDDSELFINFAEFESDGNCGVNPPLQQVIKLTKQ